MQHLGVQHLGVTLDLGSARMFPTATFETYFSSRKAIWIVTTDHYNYLILPSCAVTIDSYTSVKRSIYLFYSFFTFSLHINAVIL